MPDAVIWPVIHGHLVELIVPPHLEARAREVMPEPEVKITVREDIVGDNWIAVFSDGHETPVEGAPQFERDESP